MAKKHGPGKTPTDVYFRRRVEILRRATVKEITFAHLLAQGELTDEEAARQAGLDPAEAILLKSTARFREIFGEMSQVWKRAVAIYQFSESIAPGTGFEALDRYCGGDCGANPIKVDKNQEFPKGVATETPKRKHAKR